MTIRSGDDGARTTDQLIDAVLASAPDIRVARDDVRIVRAPGRVNLIGEHTDYNLGLVLPAAIDLEIRIAYVSTEDGSVMLTRLDDGETDGFEIAADRPRAGTWLDYVAGTAWALREADLPARGLRGVIDSNLPANAGLSSSAAIELAAAWAMLDDAAPGVDPMQLARVCQRAENGYVGVMSGLMDQFAGACGVADAALLLDCRSLDWRPVPLPEGLALVVCHTGSRRHLDGSAFNERRAQCEAAVEALALDDPSIQSLRDVTPAHLAAAGGRLDAVARRRAEHVIAENERVTATVTALEADDRATIGELFGASHESLRDLYEVSSPELDAMVEIARAVPGVVGARMTGAGFGGCTVNLVEADAVGPLRDAVERDYPAWTGLEPRVLPVRASMGAGRVRP
ncbi:MAG TPA: galactokinase [Candidatus Saccharimonadales bacterium]|nr:galactokinase [Candidatus Saccharimonadales bacterium]